MDWLNPSWLWLFGALAIPLLIHLLRRSQYREITFAAAHWLQQQPRQNWKRLWLRDKWLLLLRLLLVALLALLVARPIIDARIPEHSSILLVDPQVPRADVAKFLAERGDFAQLFWLQPKPLPFAQQQTAPIALWPTLSLLASEPQFRRAHILLANVQNPTGNRALRISPHWRWHALNRGAAAASAQGPRIALLGDAPVWLPPVIRDWIQGGSLQRELRILDSSDFEDIESFDWLIYTAPGELPGAVKEFIAAGGMLLTDQKVSAAGDFAFTLLNDKQREAAALGRGSWLRYRRDWQDPGFYQNTDFAQRIWRQWSAQDWALQARERAHWSIDNPPGMAVPDAEIAKHARQTLDTQLLLAFLLLLSLERLIALSRGGRRD